MTYAVAYEGCRTCGEGPLEVHGDAGLLGAPVTVACLNCGTIEATTMEEVEPEWDGFTEAVAGMDPVERREVAIGMVLGYLGNVVRLVVFAVAGLLLASVEGDGR